MVDACQRGDLAEEFLEYGGRDRCLGKRDRRPYCQDYGLGMTAGFSPAKLTQFTRTYLCCSRIR